MGRYNLLQEPWIKVVENDRSQTKKVSLLDIFENAPQYKRLAGETTSQDFAVIRLLLAVLHTVFNRYDLDGGEVGEDSLSEEDVKETWQKIWKNQEFPHAVIADYLNSQSDKFNLYDEKSPFLQVTEADLEKAKVTKTGSISGKLINRLISESNNKSELFAPTAEEYRNSLTDDLLARWVVAFQNFTGTGDKAKLPKMKASASKGWLLGLGIIYLQGDNLFQTLMLNFIFENQTVQHPTWEWAIDEKLKLDEAYIPKNYAEIYTNCSRLLVIDPQTDLTKKDVEIKAVQKPKLDSDAMSKYEPMTMWQIPKTGTNKGNTIPKQHNPGQSLWRSFGLVGGIDQTTEASTPQPEILSWYRSETVREVVDLKTVKITAVGMSYNRDASSMPNGELYDEFVMQDSVIGDANKNKRTLNQINLEVETTKKAIGLLGYLAKDITKIRNASDATLPEKIVEQSYYTVDTPFRNWLVNIMPRTRMNGYRLIWRKQLKTILLQQADLLIHPLTVRDLKGVPNDKTQSMENVVTQYMKFKWRLNQLLQGEE